MIGLDVKIKLRENPYGNATNRIKEALSLKYRMSIYRIVINLRQEKMSVLKLTDTKRFRKTFDKIK